MPASRAVEAQLARSRQRSEPAPSGIMAAMPTLKSCRQATSERVGWLKTAPRISGPAEPSRFQERPPKDSRRAGSAGVSLEGETHQQVDEDGNREDTHGAEQGVGGAASASEAGMDERQAGRGERHQKDAHHA